MGGTLSDFQNVPGSSTCLNWDLLVADFMGSEQYQCEYDRSVPYLTAYMPLARERKESFPTWLWTNMANPIENTYRRIEDTLTVLLIVNCAV